MAKPPAKPRDSRRVALNVDKKVTKARGAVVSVVSSKPAAPKRTITARRQKAVSNSVDSALEPVIAKRLVRKVFSEADAVPEQVTIGTSPRTPVLATTSLTKNLKGVAPTVSTRGQFAADVAVDDFTPVVLPSNVNARLESKAAALRTWYDKAFPRQVGRLCMISGLIFSAIGGLSLLPYINSVYSGWGAFQTALVCETVFCPDSPSAVASPQVSFSEVTSVPLPKVTFLTDVPTFRSASTSVVVRAEYASDVRVYSESRTTGDLIPLVRQGEPVGSDHTFVLDLEQLPADEYLVRVRVMAVRDGRKITTSGARFQVRQAEMLQVVAAQPGLESENLDRATTTLTAVESVTDDGLVSTAEVDDSELTNPTQGELRYKRTTANQITLSVTAPDALSVRLYAQRLIATTPVFIGQAQRFDNDVWRLSYDTRFLPVGFYMLVASVASGDDIRTTKRVPLVVDAPISLPATSTPPSAAVDTRVVLEKLTSNDATYPERSLYGESALQQIEATDFTAHIASRNEMPQVPEGALAVSLPLPSDRFAVSEQTLQVLLSGGVDDLNRLLQIYASVLQTDSQVLLQLVESEFAKLRMSLILPAVTDVDQNLTASDFDQSLAHAFTQLKNFVKEHEDKLIEASGQNSTRDEDLDGISDYDETFVYGTNPRVPDTDFDGFLDGVEIVRGFDPRSAVSESLLAYALPADNRFGFDDRLSIQSVVPVIEADLSRGTSGVHLEVQGQGLPNSFVTLFHYTGQSSASILTDSDGGFLYQFDSELKDGNHEMGLAMTDNSGAMIIRGSVFRFAKQGEEIVQLTDELPQTVTESALSKPVSVEQLYRVVTALGVLLLGLVLFLLAFMVRREPTVSVVSKPLANHVDQ